MRGGRFFCSSVSTNLMNRRPCRTVHCGAEAQSQFVDKKILKENPELEIYKHYDSARQPEVYSYKAEYEASVRTVDAALGDFFGFLHRHPWFDEALIIITGDHRDSFERGYLYHGEELYDKLKLGTTGDSLSWAKQRRECRG